MKAMRLAGLIHAAALSVAAMAAAPSAPNASPPPVAPVRDTPETMHGVTVHDPYRYMENVKDPQVLGWMRAQGDYARHVLDGIPGRDAIARRVAELTRATGDSYATLIRVPGDHVFFLRRGKDERQYKLVVRTGGVDKVLADPEVEAKKTGVPHAINYFQPSWDGKYVAYGMSAGGSEDASLYIVEVATGKLIGEPVPRVQEAHIAWLPDSKSVTYNQLRQLTAEDAESEFYLDSKVMWLKVGAPASEAKAVFGPTVNKQLGLARLDVGQLMFTPGSPWVLARTTDTTRPEGSIYLARVSDFGQGDVPWKQIVSPADKVVEMALKGDDLFLRTHKDAPRFRIVKLDLRQPDIAKAREVASPAAGDVFEGFNVGPGGLLVAVRNGQEVGLREFRWGDRKGAAIKLPFRGAANIGTNQTMAYDPEPAHASSQWMFKFAGWTEPARILVASQGHVKEGPFPTGNHPAGVPELEITDVKVPSWDGAQVPMTILHRKGLKLDGNNPTLLKGYGSYGLSMTAHYDPTSYAWFERGGVIAYVNVRGSGVYGEPWHLAGFKTTKPNTWKDGVAAAQWLQGHGYASPKTMTVIGGSAGGIFVGRAVTTAPQIFAAAVFEVPEMDAIRSELSANGITNISEFGTIKDPVEFKALLEMSTYHQIADGTSYPAVMFVHGLNDPRVDVWHSAKAAARLQAASTSGKPVLLRLDAQAGHGVGSTSAQRNSLTADIYSFLLWQTGKLAAH